MDFYDPKNIIVKEGATAYIRGYDKSENPYASEPEYSEWNRGWEYEQLMQE